MSKRLLIVVGTRPNFIKVTRFKEVIHDCGADIDCKIVHTGQHYDKNMAEVFFQQFGLEPDYFLNVGKASATSQMADIMKGIEDVSLEFDPDLIMVPGDVNSTFAAALAANKMGKRIAHLESGLRSFDRSMPEEINRILTDEISDHLFVTEQSGLDNLKNEGITDERVHFVGNTMIDTIVAYDDCIRASDVMKRLNVEAGNFILMTMHRPAIVDAKEGLKTLLRVLELVTKRTKVVFPIHPRTKESMARNRVFKKLVANKNILITEPLDYFAFQNLVLNCKFVLTDSGGIQEETTYRKVPCITLRTSTERPITCSLGTNELVKFDFELLKEKIANIDAVKGQIPPLWDGKATNRILEVLNRVF